MSGHAGQKPPRRMSRQYRLTRLLIILMWAYEKGVTPERAAVLEARHRIVENTLLGWSE